MSVKIVQLKKADMAAVRDLNHLLPQLRGRKSNAGSLSDLRNIINDRNITMIVAQDSKRIVGMGTLYVLPKIGKKSGTVEDVVVDSAYRGRGLGKKITRKLIDSARKNKVNTLHLTSRPSRVPANALYRKLGFKLNKTNPYILHL